MPSAQGSNAQVVSVPEFLNKPPKSFVPHTCKVWLLDIDSICSLKFRCVKFGCIFEEYAVISGTEVASFQQMAREIYQG